MEISFTINGQTSEPIVLTNDEEVLKDFLTRLEESIRNSWKN